MAVRVKPEGVLTRGTTNPNRLRRSDRFCAGPLVPIFRGTDARPTVLDLGFGATPVTSVEWVRRLAAFVPGVRLVGVEISQERVDAAGPWASEDCVFLRGGFECPVPEGWGDPVLIRAFNVLRQYPEDAVASAWSRMTGRLAPGGVLLDGTCDEIGRLASWIIVDAHGPVSLTLSVGLRWLERPSDVAERLPKALIHRNVPGERVHDWLTALDRAWERSAPMSVFGVRQRWLATVQGVKDEGWPVLHGPTRWRLGEVTVPWASVSPS